MTQSFGDAATAAVYHGRNDKAARSIPRGLWPVVRRKLDLVNTAQSLEDLKAPPGNKLEALKREKGRHSIRVNKQYRLTFRFDKRNAFEVI